MSEVLRMRFARAPQRSAKGDLPTWSPQQTPSPGEKSTGPAAGARGKKKGAKTTQPFLARLEDSTPQQARNLSAAFVQSAAFVNSGHH